MTNKAAALADLSRADAAIMTEGLAGLPDRKKLAVAEVLTSGVASCFSTARKRGSPRRRGNRK